MNPALLTTLQQINDGMMLLRAGKGNPNHKGKGPEGGQFASGPGGGGAATKHGKHWAARQRRKKKLAAKHAKERKALRIRQRKEGKSFSARQKETKSLRDRHTAERQEAVATREPAAKIDKSKQSDRERKGKPKILSDKAALAQKHMSITDKTTQDYTKANEHVFASRMGGKSFPDNDPIDVSVKGGGVGGKDAGIELKTLTHGKNDKITMTSGALARKEAWEKQNDSQMHTVALDHRDRFEGGKNATLHSGHEIYYKRGVGSFRIGTMYKAKDETELKTLIRTPYDRLPKAAQGPIRKVKRSVEA
jgi:hypothetical protein